MRLPQKLSLLLVLTSLAPLGIAGLVAVPRAQAELRAQLSQLYAQSAQTLALRVLADQEGQKRQFTLVAEPLSAALLDADAEVARQAVKFVYESVEEASVVSLLSENGDARFLRYGEKRQGTHGGMDKEALKRFGEHLPRAEALASNALAVSAPYVSDDEEGKPLMRVALALPIEADEQRGLLAMEVALRGLDRVLSAFQVGATGRARLLDSSDRVLVGTDEEVREGRTHPLTAEMMGAVAPVPDSSMKVLVEQAKSEALKPVRDIQHVSMLALGIGLLFAVALGVTTVRTVTKPLASLTEASERVAEGKLDVEVKATSKDELGKLAEAFNGMVRGLRERDRLKQTFSRYVSSGIAARILKETSDLDLKGELVEATAMFIDIRGYTTLSERHTPHEVVDLLNTYFERIVGVVLAHDGEVNKFIGDAILVVFGVPDVMPEPEKRAVRAALEIQKVVAALNEERKAEGKEAAEFGIGINTGPAIAGNLGSKQRLEYTVIGDAVNVAQRLQASATPGTVVVSAATLSKCDNFFHSEPLGDIKVKGKEKAITVFRVLQG